MTRPLTDYLSAAEAFEKLRREAYDFPCAYATRRLGVYGAFDEVARSTPLPVMVRELVAEVERLTNECVALEAVITKRPFRATLEDRISRSMGESHDDKS